jgi:hypothetical protein
MTSMSKRRTLSLLALGLAAALSTNSAVALEGIPAEMWANVPQPAQQACVSAAIEGRTFTNVRVHELPYLDNTLFEFKTLTNSGQLGRFCIDEAGVQVPDCGKAMRSANAKLRYADYGAIEPALWAQLQSVPGEYRVPVGVWLHTVEEYVDPRASAARIATAKANNTEKQRNVKDAFTRLTKRLGIDTVRPILGAPAAEAMLTPAQVLALAREWPVVSLTWEGPRTPQSTAYFDTVQPTRSATDCGTNYCTGVDMGVCVVQDDKASDPAEVRIEASYCGYGNASTHSECVGALIAAEDAPHGLAEDADVFFADSLNCYGSHADALAWCNEQDYTFTINWSETCSALDNRLLDYWAKQSIWRLIVVAAGNEGPSAVSCGNSCGSGAIGTTTCKGYNFLNVGAANDCGTTVRSDDEVACFTSSQNYNGDNEVPHLVAPGQNIHYSQATQCGSGTSFAAPIVSGIASQVMQKGGLEGQPSLVRAILMATADEDTDGTRMTRAGWTQTDHRDGVGEVNASLAIDLADPDNVADGSTDGTENGYHFVAFNEDDNPGGFQGDTYYLKTTQSGKKARIVFVWGGIGTCRNAEAGDCQDQTLDADIDLQVVGNGTTYWSSSVDNSYEFMEIPLAANQTYTIKTYIYDWNTGITWGGIAWYVDDFDN